MNQISHVVSGAEQQSNIHVYWFCLHVDECEYLKVMQPNEAKAFRVWWQISHLSENCLKSDC